MGTRRELLQATAAAILFAGTPGAAWAGPLGDLSLYSIDGTPMPREVLDGQVVLFVNVASYCGNTPQYSSLQALYTRFKDRGFVVVGVPCNQFGGQEPGSATEIKSFCSSRYGVTFPLLSKQDVNGPSRSPLYRYLIDSPVGGGKDISWNFEKFLVGRDGRVLARFPSWMVPLDPAVLAGIEIAIGRAGA